MVPRLGIDLGTTFSCVAWVNEQGQPQVIPNAEGETTTPSVICFDGRQAWVGKKANARKETHPFAIREFVKRDMGKPPHPRDGETDADAAPYEFNGFCYAAPGMSALILRKLKRDALKFLKRAGVLNELADERSTTLDAVITVPAYFGGYERDATKLAGYAAGLNVIGIINEPTAAALSYGLSRQKDARILVFDLGGGTFDVTILQMHSADAAVLTTMGDNSLGGKDWDALIQQYLYDCFERVHGRPIPDDRGFEVQELALRAKFELTEAPTALVSMSFEDCDLELTLHERAPRDFGAFEVNAQNEPFYFEARASELLHRLESLCEDAIRRVTIQASGGHSRPMQWSDLDEIVLAGGACRMPMIPRMLERISGKKIRQHIEGFNYDTAIAIGAALYSRNRGRVNDVMSHTVGILLCKDGRQMIEPIIRKDTRLPTDESRAFPAGANAYVEVYEVAREESLATPDESRKRGRLDLENPGAIGEVLLTFRVDEGGLLKIEARYPPDEQRQLELKDVGRWSTKEAEQLRENVMAIKMS